LLACAGLDDWVANDEGDYATRAIALGSDVDRLARLRSSLRERVCASPLFDAPLFARHLEEALRGMWEHKMDDKRPQARE
jgi:predicted O-linked N-acetylglucosamine transferase (SPINDLY family)